MIPGSMELVSTPTLRQYRVSGGVFYKTGLDDPEVEYEKAGWLYDLSMTEGFVAPRPLNSDVAKGSLGMEYLEDLVPIRTYYLDYLLARNPRRKCLELLTEAGRVLAAIHQRELPKGAACWIASPEFRRDYEESSGSPLDIDMAAVPLVPLHCDYGFSNVCVTSRGQVDVVAVIDPSANGFVTFQSSLIAPPYIDVANFVTCIEGLVPIGCYPRAKWSRLPDLRSAFLQGYLGKGNSLDSRVLRGTVFATASAYFRRKFGSGLKKKLALLMLFNSWKGNVAKS